MSDNMSLNDITEECERKLSLVIRKVQEGKTHICITNITIDRTKDIHIVLTMNTLSSGMQLFGRMELKVGANRIIVFNSKKNTAGDCYHAKNVSDIFTLIRKNPDIKVIVCCAHEKRIRACIPELFIQATDMNSFANRKFVIHIDEAHKYIPENEEHIRNYNRSPVIKSIIGYSGSPIGIWSNRPEDPLFHKILIRDIEEEFKIMRSPMYFGVHSCDHIVVEIEQGFDMAKMIEDANISPEISNFAWIHSDMTENNKPTWYGEKSYFDLGNEVQFLSFLSYVLDRIAIPQEAFSYNFVPAYTRKATHYQTVEIILSKFPKANVIVMNGNGMELFRQCSSHLTPGAKISKRIITDKAIKDRASPELLKQLLEPSYMIQKLIEGRENRPTFITGQTCVGMSVTLINEIIGNFDNVIMAHQHFSADKLYQLCRFLFNFTNWTQENKDKIKTTKLYSLTKSVIDTCMKYEQEVEHMSADFAGKTCSLRELQGLKPEEPSALEQKTADLSKITLHNENDNWKKFKVYDGNDHEVWSQVNTFYKEKTGKDIPSRSRPKKINPNTKEPADFYYSSTTKKLDIQTNATIKTMTNYSWWSVYQLVQGKLNYARIFVGYDNIEDPTEYTIYIKYVQLQNTEENIALLNKYGKPRSKKQSAGISSTSAMNDQDEDDDEDDEI